MDRLPNKLPVFSSKSLRAKVVLSYIFDYVIIIVLGGAFYALDAIEPFHQQFSLRNYTLRYPFAVHERVPIPLLGGLIFVAPAIIIALYTLVIDGLFSTKVGGRRTKYSFKSRLWELNCGILGLMLGIGAAFVITGALKNAIGKPRPDLIDRCKPNPEIAQALLVTGNYSLAQHSICQQTDNAILKDGFRSFPSGHSSSAFAGLFYLSLYLSGKLHLLDSRGEVWKLFFVLVPTLGAALIAGSRIMDARHHPFDVITGSLLGILMAWAAYRQYFPPLSDFRAKGRAYPIRTWGSISDHHEEIDMMPLRNHAEDTGFVTGRDSPSHGASGNAFRDEINRSQRRRNVDRSTDDLAPPMPPPASGPQYTAANPFNRSNSRRQYTRDTWDESTDDEADPRDLELQQTYTASRQPDPIHYDPPVGMAQDTSYSAYKPPPAQAEISSPRLSAQNTAATEPPQLPAHGQTRGMTLTESYVAK